MTKKKVICLIAAVILVVLMIGIAVACSCKCKEGWHCCPTANGGCGCFLDAIQC
jgi:hypothetical protein